MKRLLLTLASLLIIFLFIWGYKMRQPINVPQQTIHTESSSSSQPSNTMEHMNPQSESASTPSEPDSTSNPGSSKPETNSSSYKNETVREIVEQEIQDGEYTVKQQIVITKTYDENGELLSTKKSEPVEIERWLTE